MLLLHTRREQGARTSSAVMSARLSVWAKITGHRTPTSQLSAAVSTDYTQHTIPVYAETCTQVRTNARRLPRKGCIAFTIAPTTSGTNFVGQSNCLFSISGIVAHIIRLLLRREIEVHLIILVHLDNTHTHHALQVYNVCQKYSKNAENVKKYVIHDI